MADGATNIAEAHSGVAESGGGNPLNVVIKTRFRFLLTLAGVAALSLATAVALRLYGGSQPISVNDVTPAEYAWFAVASTVVWLPLLLLTLDPPDNMAHGPRLALPLSTLAILAATAAIVAWDFQNSHAILNSTGSAGLAAIFAACALAFIPRIFNAALFARHKQREIAERAAELERRRASDDAEVVARAVEIEMRTQEHNDAEALGAFVATVTVIGVCVLAWFAGGMDDGPAAGLKNIVGIGIAAAVIGLFVIVVFLDWIAEFPLIRSASRTLRGVSGRMRWLAAVYNAIDSLLVRIGAHAAGAEHHYTRSRYTVLAGTMLCLVILTWALPEPYGLVPAAVGFLLGLSVSRLWSWVEEDRTLAAITQFSPDAPRKVGFREDFRDEALLGFIFVLVLIPLAMMQAHNANLFGGPLFETKGNADMHGIGVWFGYFGFELAKALPVVDWADIYHLQPAADMIVPTRPIGMHAVFAARVTVDLVLIAALLQAIGIATRNRQQKALFAAGHIDRLDELVEKAELSRAINRRRANWFPGPVDFRRYNADRLKEIFSGTTNLRLKTFISVIFEQSGRTLDPAIIVLARLAANHGDETELYRTFDAVKAEHALDPRFASVGDLVEVMASLRNRSGLRDLKFAIITFATKIGSPGETADMLSRIMFSSLRDAFQYTRIEAAKAMTALAPKLSECSLLTELVSFMEGDSTTFGSSKFVPEALLEALRKRRDEACRPPST